MIIKIDKEKAFHKIWHTFIVKKPQQSGNRRGIPKHKWHVFKNLHPNSLHRQKLTQNGSAAEIQKLIL